MATQGYFNFNPPKKEVVYHTACCYVCQRPFEVDGFNVNFLLPESKVTVGHIIQKILRPSLASWTRIQQESICSVCCNQLQTYIHYEEKLAQCRADFHHMYKLCCEVYNDAYYVNGTIDIGCQTEGVHDNAISKCELIKAVEEMEEINGPNDEEMECQEEGINIPDNDIAVKKEYETVVEEFKSKRRRKTRGRVKFTPMRKKTKVNDVEDKVPSELSDCEEEDAEEEREDPDFRDFDEIYKSEPDSSPMERKPASRSQSKSKRRPPRKPYSRKKHPCEHCSRVFRRPGELRNHVLVSHMHRNPNQCPTCGRKFNSRNGLYVHLKRVHHVEYEERMAIVSDLERTLDKDVDLSSLSLDIISKSPEQNDNSPVHSEIEDASIERYGAGSESDWAADTQKNRKGKNRTKVVKVKYLDQGGIGEEEFVEEQGETKEKKKKKRSRVGDRYTLPLIHECDMCGKKWRTKPELKAHIRTHSELRPFVCEICGQGYKGRKALLIHVGMHEGVHPFTCMHCNKSFTQKGGLVKHMNIHNQNRKYTCDVCGKSFIHSTSFEFHKLVHTGHRQVQCSICNISLSTKSHLNRHMLVHTGDKPFECSVCGTRFAKKWNRNVHELKLHGIEPGPKGGKRVALSEDGPVVDPRNPVAAVVNITLDGDNTTPRETTERAQIASRGSRKKTNTIPPEPSGLSLIHSEKCELCDFRPAKSQSLSEHWEREHGRFLRHYEYAL